MTAGMQIEEPTFSMSTKKWKVLAGIQLAIIIGLLIGLIVIASQPGGDDSTRKAVSSHSESSAESGTSCKSPEASDFVDCGAGQNANGNSIDLDEPENPGPFHDLTKNEMRKLREFLEKDPEIQAVSMKNFSSVTINSSYIFLADLWPPKKAEALDFLDSKGRTRSK
ncbi:amine oxidase [Elysia marginata]|uniref:Amine oxidase n=1 Tax=Elysia marginata TaxID=1093978 RepID=A0AAV4K027_9GAST|nr:amine oxidase [Elysia marginata]